jgi:hypothetical protein
MDLEKDQITSPLHMSDITRLIVDLATVLSLIRRQFLPARNPDT